MKVVISAVAAAVVLSGLPAGAGAATRARPVGLSIPKAVVKVSKSEVTEGDRLTLRVRVPQAATARRAVLQERRIDIFGNAAWEDVDSKRAGARVRFRTTVTATNEAVYRVAVTYRARVKPVLSRTAEVAVWRWISLRDFAPYFETSPNVDDGNDTLNGAAYLTFGLHYNLSYMRSWESRITPGRNCTAFRAVLGLSDRSDDGSTGKLSFTADDAHIYESPPLTPGMTVPVAFQLAEPYRFGLIATNTSAEAVAAYPMVGNGELYCTGIDD